MRSLALLFLIGVAAPPPNAPSLPNEPGCVDDYVTIETVRGTIIEIKLAPEPFKSADIFLTGPAGCSRMWMQVLKTDAEGCHVGDAVEATGIITSDPENDAWSINPTQSEYMRLKDDFICKEG